MKSLQRVLALLLAIVLTFGLLPAGIFHVHATESVSSGAADEESGDVDVPVVDGDATEPSVDPDAPMSDSVLTVTHAASTVYPGDEITLTVRLSGDNAWTSLGYIPITDSAAFEVISGEVLPLGQTAELWDFTAADGGLLYCSDPVAIEGNLFCFTVRIRDDAPAGEYAVTDAVALNSAGKKIPVSLNDAAITVGKVLPQGVIAMGECGDDLTWTLEEDGSVTVCGTGAMYDYVTDAAPWRDYMKFIETVHLEEGVTSVGNWSFYGCGKLASVTVGQSVTDIGEAAFDPALADVYYAGLLAQWKEIAVADGNDWLLTATIHAADDKYCAHCDKAVAWSEWTGISAPVSGHYYLSGDLVSEQTEYLLIAEDTDVVLDLCGHTYTAANGSLFQINGRLSVVDSAQGGALTAPDGFSPEAANPMLHVVGAGAALNLYSGKICGGVAAYGGNILAENNASVDLYGGTVSGGTAVHSGGNICLLDGATLIINGGTVSGGKADLGGNIGVHSGSRFAVTGGTVTGGIADEGGNIYTVGRDGSVTLFGICGGKVTGDIAVCTYSEVYLEGSPVVTKGTVCGLSIEDNLILLGELSEGASIAVSANGVFTEASENAANYAQYFTSADYAYSIVVKDGALACERRYLDTDFAIVTQPAEVEITAGFIAQFTVEAINFASFKWQYRRNETAPWVNTTLSGYATATLSVPAILGRTGYQYRCRVTGNNGKILYTEPAALTVNDSIIINTQPTRQIVGVDENAVFTVDAEGAGLTYQWLYRKNSDDFWKTTGMTGNKTNSLTVPAIVSRNGYQYRCAITDENGIKIHSSFATLSAIGFTEHPADRTVTAGSNAVFTVAAKGQELTYQWQYRKSETGSWMTTSLSGAKTDTLTVPALATRDGYQYRCVITDALGVIRYSDPATLTVTEQ